MNIIALCFSTIVSLISATYTILIATKVPLKLPASIFEILFSILLPAIAFSLIFALSTKKRPVAKETEALIISFAASLFQAIFTICSVYRLSLSSATIETSLIITEAIIIVISFAIGLAFAIKATKNRHALKDFSSGKLAVITLSTGTVLALLKVVPFIIQKIQPDFSAIASSLLSSGVLLSGLSPALFAVAVYLTVTGQKKSHTFLAWVGFCLVSLSEIIIWVLA